MAKKKGNTRKNGKDGRADAGTGRNEGANLKTAAILMAAALVAELSGFAVSGSLALLADSLFIMSELMLLAMAMGMPRSNNAVTAAMFLSLLILISGLYVLYLAPSMFILAAEVRGTEMLVFAAAGLALGTASMRKSRHAAGAGGKASFVRVLRKTLSSLLVISAAVWIAFTGEFFADFLSGFAIGLIVVFESLVLFRDFACMLLGKSKPKTRLFKNLE